MDLTEIAFRIEELPLATAIRSGMSWRWLYPSIEAAHVVGIAVVFGSILLLDLRLLGVGERAARVSKYAMELLPLTWVAFGLSLVTGALLFIANASSYVFNLQFRWKMLAIVLAGLNMLIFHRGIYRHVHEWDSRLPPPNAARVAGLLSIVCWTSVVFLGRWIGFVR